MRYRVWNKVWIKESKDDPKNYQPRQRGTVIGVDEEKQTYRVKLDPDYWDEEEDDGIKNGIREVSEDQIDVYRSGPSLTVR